MGLALVWGQASQYRNGMHIIGVEEVVFVMMVAGFAKFALEAAS